MRYNFLKVIWHFYFSFGKLRPVMLLQIQRKPNFKWQTHLNMYMCTFSLKQKIAVDYYFRWYFTIDRILVCIKLKLLSFSKFLKYLFHSYYFDSIILSILGFYILMKKCWSQNGFLIFQKYISWQDRQQMCKFSLIILEQLSKNGFGNQFLLHAYGQLNFKTHKSFSILSLKMWLVLKNELNVSACATWGLARNIKEASAEKLFKTWIQSYSDYANYFIDHLDTHSTWLQLRNR